MRISTFYRKIRNGDFHQWFMGLGNDPAERHEKFWKTYQSWIESENFERCAENKLAEQPSPFGPLELGKAFIDIFLILALDQLYPEDIEQYLAQITDPMKLLRAIESLKVKDCVIAGVPEDAF